MFDNGIPTSAQVVLLPGYLKVVHVSMYVIEVYFVLLLESGAKVLAQLSGLVIGSEVHPEQVSHLANWSFGLAPLKYKDLNLQVIHCLSELMQTL